MGEVVDRVVDADTDKRGAEHQGDDVQLTEDQDPGARGGEDPPREREQRHEQEEGGSEQDHEEQRDAGERDGGDPPHVLSGELLRGCCEAVDGASFQRQDRAEAGVEGAEGTLDEVGQRRLVLRVECRVPRGQEEDRVGGFYVHEMTVAQPHAAQACCLETSQHGRKGEQRVRGRDCLDELRFGQHEFVAQSPGRGAQPGVGQALAQLHLGPAREEEQAAWEVDFEDVGGEPGARPRSYRDGLGVVLEDARPVVGGGDRGLHAGCAEAQDHRARQSGVRNPSGQRRELELGLLSEEMGEAGREF
jgi:hypothetical protein